MRLEKVIFNMTNEIIEKLNEHVRDGIKTEADVMYLFVQIAKLIERMKKKEEYPILKFYRDWIVHDKLCGPTTIEIVLGKLEAAEEAFIAGDIESIDNIITDILAIHKLVVEMDKFFISDHGFSKDIGTRLKSSHILTEKLLAILRDLPLIDDRGKYKCVKEFRFTSPQHETELTRAIISFKTRDEEVVIPNSS